MATRHVGRGSRAGSPPRVSCALEADGAQLAPWTSAESVAWEHTASKVSSLQIGNRHEGNEVV
jgi:hypothetical protein